jgi:hypothetical protein
MSENKAIPQANADPVRIVHSIEEILKYVHPGPDEETERFVAAIYADRRESARLTSSE